MRRGVFVAAGLCLLVPSCLWHRTYQTEECVDGRAGQCPTKESVRSEIHCSQRVVSVDEGPVFVATDAAVSPDKCCYLVTREEADCD